MAEKEWSGKDSAELYNLKGWSQKYFRINAEGNLAFHPKGLLKKEIDIKRVVDDVASRGIKLPAMIRFQDILRDRVAILNRAFRRAIEDHQYTGKYMGVYPIKVNQLREVVEEIIDAGKPFRMGLEAGSKAELMTVLAMNNTDGLTILNGYKDHTMMRLVCLGLKMGKRIFVVIEKLSELDELLAASEEFGVRPLIGLRAKLQTPGSGRWASSAGQKAKFGLTTPEILSAFQKLKERDMLDCAKLLHFHIGSQVAEITAIQSAVKEATRIYCKLYKMGLPMEFIDCGGGLGVDYEGTRSSHDLSINYSLEEYVRDVVYSIQEVCRQEKVPEPNIVTESGRSLTAHHAMLVVNVFGRIRVSATPVAINPERERNQVVTEIRDVIASVTDENLTESYHDGLQRLEEAQSLFRLGYLTLEDKGEVESLFWRLCLDIKKRMSALEEIPEALRAMATDLDDQYLVNFSVFQSLADVWAIDHIFPIMPIHRLNEKPDRDAILADITCDSDGKISNFVCNRDVRKTLPVHRLNKEPYYMGIFLIGAYQSTMGDIHNLFGRVNEVHVFEDNDEPGGYYLEEIIKGESIAEVLTSIQYNEYDLVRMVKAGIDARVKAGQIKPKEGVDLLNLYETIMKEYTYIENRGAGNGRLKPEANDEAAGVEVGLPS